MLTWRARRVGPALPATSPFPFNNPTSYLSGESLAKPYIATESWVLSFCPGGRVDPLVTEGTSLRDISARFEPWCHSVFDRHLHPVAKGGKLLI